MVAKDGGYFGRPYKGYRGFTQGDPLSSTIFIVVVDAVIRHWLKVVTPTGAGTGGLGLRIIDLVAYFYADDKLVASTQPDRIQRAFDVFTGLFDRVGLRKNTAKTVNMVYQPCHATRGVSEAAYVRRVTGEGPTFWERHWMWV